MATRLTKSNDRMLAGVCGGLAEFLGWQPRAVRTFWVAVGILTGGIPALVVYTLLAATMPPNPSKPRKFNLEDHRVQ
jgi:phage shock protein C